MKDFMQIYITPSQNLGIKKIEGGENKPNGLFENIEKEFIKSTADGLLYLAKQNKQQWQEETFLYWLDFINHYLYRLCVYDGNQSKQIHVLVDEQFLSEKIESLPPMIGGEYLNFSGLMKIWYEINFKVSETLIKEGLSLDLYISQAFPHWDTVGKVYFHLAENKTNPEWPFAFLVTYSTKLNEKAKPKHLPLGSAIENATSEKNKKLIRNILQPLQNISVECDFIKGLLDRREIFQPQIWSPSQAFSFLKNTHIYEKHGVVVRIPNWWNPKKPIKPQIKVTLGEEEPSYVGIHSLLNFQIDLCLGDSSLTEEEVFAIMNAKSQFVNLRGIWVEVDKEKLKEVLNHWKSALKATNETGVSFLQGMRLLAGASLAKDDEKSNSLSDDLRSWTSITAGKWFDEILNGLRSPENNKFISPNFEEKLNATLRPYQKSGVNWLWLLYNLKLGGCLADDMGLGKTIQVISLLLCIKESRKKSKPSLLIVPATLIGNWKAEISKFAPSICYFIAHTSEMEKMNQNNFEQDLIDDYDVIITTYSSLNRISWLQSCEWDLVILDEAQAIKNPAAKQTLACKQFKSKMRLSLTGTPVENNLIDLWSILDFSCPGLLGNIKEFSIYSKKIKQQSAKLEENVYRPLRQLVKPYILRRLKTDPKIISDLPDKTELKTYCHLTLKQISFYNQAVSELAQSLQGLDGIKRQGIIFSYINRFKQICNHPDQWLKEGEYDLLQSGKFIRLKEILTEIAEKQEKVLIFTQYKEIIDVLNEVAQSIFNQEGLLLHGSIAIKKRKELVDNFQSEFGSPFFILSLKAGGTGLNLVAANHVIHFDRWWNPAVENQATDRAFRIGQKKNVLVHKFICQGTIEDKIDSMIEDKKFLSNEILEGDSQISITSLSNEEIIKLVSLDINKAMGDETSEK
ncbi:MAG: DEAD/DEAH box helicase [Silvanigrellaceae bacterium]|nr:DEAD/DEAH box helicase [Silvanigrellaceae bacterium]